MKTISVTLLLIATLITAYDAKATVLSGEKYLKKWGIPYHTVIAHRGASYDAPEETEPAYLLARDLGADYLEADIQRTKDGVLICLHDNNLKRTSNISSLNPDRAEKPVSDFTLAELKKLDAGSWFNKEFPKSYREKYAGLKILTLEELITIAESGKNKPGIYLETKNPSLFPGIEKDISVLLKKRGWMDPSKKERVIMQTFSPKSLPLLKEFMPEIPAVFLLWLDDGAMQSTTPNKIPAPGQLMPDLRATLQVTKEEFKKWILFAKNNGASGTGPGSSLTNLGSQSYMDLVKPWMNELTHTEGLFIHAYTVDEKVDMMKFTAAGVDGFFTNRPDVLLEFYGRKSKKSVGDLLKELNY